MEGSASAFKGKTAVDTPDDLALDLDFDMPDDPDELLTWMEDRSDKEKRGTSPKVSTPTATESGEEQYAQHAEPIYTNDLTSASLLSDNDDFTLPEEQEFDDFGIFDPSPIDEILGTTEAKSDKNDRYLSDSMPEWLSFTGDGNKTDWLSALPGADVSGWLEAEDDDKTDADWSNIGKSRPRPRKNKSIKRKTSVPQTVQTEELHLPETGLLSGFNLDGQELRDARHLVNNGETDSSLTAYRSLIQKGEGLNVIIADLEVATQKFKGEPKISQLLGDAYTQNGQLQKALDTYRSTLDMM